MENSPFDPSVNGTSSTFLLFQAKSKVRNILFMKSQWKSFSCSIYLTSIVQSKPDLLPLCDQDKKLMMRVYFQADILWLGIFTNDHLWKIYTVDIFDPNISENVVSGGFSWKVWGKTWGKMEINECGPLEVSKLCSSFCDVLLERLSRFPAL